MFVLRQDDDRRGEEKKGRIGRRESLRTAKDRK